MYKALTLASKHAITEEQFVQQYTELANEVALSELDYDIINSLAEIKYFYRNISSINN